MADNERFGDPGGLEGDEGGRLHYSCLVVIIPPGEDEEGNLVSLFRETDIYSTFIVDLIESIDEDRAPEGVTIKVLDLSDLGLALDSKDDYDLYYRLMDKVISRLDSPLICMCASSDSLTEMINDVILAEETERHAGCEVALFNVIDPEKVYGEITQDITYLIGCGGMKFHLPNILEKKYQGPLLSEEQTLEYMEEQLKDMM
jgi:hypothetical protein